MICAARAREKRVDSRYTPPLVVAELSWSSVTNGSNERRAPILDLCFLTVRTRPRCVVNRIRFRRRFHRERLAIRISFGGSLSSVASSSCIRVYRRSCTCSSDIASRQRPPGKAVFEAHHSHATSAVLAPVVGMRLACNLSAAACNLACISHAIYPAPYRSEVCHSAAGSIKPAGHIAVTREHEAA